MMKKIISISAAIFAYCILVTANCFSQGTAINSTGAPATSSAILDLSSTSKGLRIPRVGLTDTSSAVTPINNPANGLLVFDTLTGAAGSGITPGFYYWDASKTQWLQLISSAGAGSGAACSHTIGESFGGGKIFYVDISGCHGLIAATSDQSTSAPWSNIINGYSGAYSNNGLANTIGIITQGATSGAAYICDNLSLAGFSDWFLPSKEELSMIYMKRNIIGGFTNNLYWSSTEYHNTFAVTHYFTDGNLANVSKNSNFYVRCARAF